MYLPQSKIKTPIELAQLKVALMRLKDTRSSLSSAGEKLLSYRVGSMLAEIEEIIVNHRLYEDARARVG